MNPMYAFDLDQAYRQQQMQNAENERAAKAAQKENRDFSRAILAHAGSQMVAWGVELQLRYGHIQLGNTGDVRRVRLSLLKRAQ
jgi:hypothetical protein